MGIIQVCKNGLGRSVFMCTCITYENGSFYFGRNLDLDVSFGQRVVVTPRNFPLRFRTGGEWERRDVGKHYAMIGMAAGEDRYPLYAEAVNEKGLCMACLNFPGYAVYKKPEHGKKNIASYELIPWILSVCASVREAEEMLKNVNITDEAFSAQMPPAPLHWMLSDRRESLVIEPLSESVRIYENPVGVLTNNPPFEYHLHNLGHYLNVTARFPDNRFSKALDLAPCSAGTGGVGLPGDASSASRFVRAAFLKWNSVSPPEEQADVAQVFHILEGTAMVRGTVVTEGGGYDRTWYTCCVNADTGVYCFRTYDDLRIQTVEMHSFELEGSRLSAI